MKNKETEYLNNLFARSSDKNGAEIDFPVLDAPENLSNKLYAITEQTPSDSGLAIGGSFKSWPKLTSIAASLLVAVILFQVYQQQQTIKQLEQAQSDLAVALHYLGETNKIVQLQMSNSLNANLSKETFEPVLQIGRSAILQSAESLESLTNKTNRNL